MDDMEVVSALRATLADKVGQDRFDLWFGSHARLCLRDSALTVEVPNRFYQDWLRSNFRQEIEASCEETLGKPVSLEFRIAETPGQPKQGVVTKAPDKAVKHATEESPPREAAASAARRRFASLEGFVVGPSNRLAHSSAQSILDQPGCYSPLLLYGPTGVGKTHLLEGIWTAARKMRRPINAIYLSAEQFTTCFLEALHGSGLPNFRRKYRGVELLLVDDLQFFANKKATLVELLHTIDTLTKDGRQIVLSADRPLADLRELGAELTARLAGGMACRVDPPEHQTRLGIVRQIAGRLDISIPDDVQEYVAMHLSSHARELLGAVNRLHATSRAWDRPITKALAEEVLAEMVRHCGRVLKLTDIEKAVCDVFGLEPKALQSGRKGRTASHPRVLAMWLARKHTRAALSEIGAFFGRRSHSTVISANKKVGDWMAHQTAVELGGREFSVEDAIRRVEAVFKAG